MGGCNDVMEKGKQKGRKRGKVRGRKNKTRGTSTNA